MLGKQHQFIIDLLSDGKPHCSNEIPFRDYRRRVQDLIEGLNAEKKRYPIKKELCRGRCGRQHGSGVNWLWMEGLEISRGGAAVAHRPHNPVYAGSNPAPATIFPKTERPREWRFRSETDPKIIYTAVDFTAYFVCNCPGYDRGHHICWHIKQVKFMEANNIPIPDEPMTKTQCLALKPQQAELFK